MPLALTCYFGLLSKVSKADAFKLGLSFGLGWFGAGISWVHVSIAQFGGLPLAGSLGLMLLLCAYLAIFPAVISKLIKQYVQPRLWPFALPFIWLLVEWLRSWLLTGFPWLSLGYSQINSPLAGWLPIIGEFGVSGILVMTASLCAVWMTQQRYLHTVTALLIIFSSGWLLNQYQWVKPKGEAVSIAMVQGNIEQGLRWAPEQDSPTMEKYTKLTQKNWHNEVIIWPEAAIPKLEPLASQYLTDLDGLAATHKTGIISGIVDYNFETRQAYNSLIGFGLQRAKDDQGHYYYGHSNRYAKHHLLPIGEFIPMEDWLRGLAPIFDLPMSSFARGSYQQQNLLVNGYHFAPALCFEIAFPVQIAANITLDTDFIITVSNDAWFGRSHGPAQHLQIAQVRAKEFGLPVLRATNNGITAFIDHNGAIQSRLPQFETGVLSDEIQRVEGITPYRYFGNSLAWLLALLGLIIAIRRQS
ncbi:MAG: apolipoprotein N-acyltransferase [Paraglaciecola sp.]|jgi:apolipoprotein N-acyltransferase